MTMRIVRRSVVCLADNNSRVQKSHRKACDINTIMRKCKKTGLIPGRGEAGFYGDFTGIGDYQSCVERIDQANENFMHLPANIRKRFDNNPAGLLAFLEDANNKEEAIELGILPKPDPPDSVVAEPVVVDPVAGESGV